jgi:hypothetical protein
MLLPFLMIGGCGMYMSVGEEVDGVSISFSEI